MLRPIVSPILALTLAIPQLAANPASAAEPLSRIWHPTMLFSDVSALLRAEQWNEAVDKLLAEDLALLPTKRRSEARAVLAEAVTRLDVEKGRRELDKIIEGNPLPSLPVAILLALHDQCSRATAILAALGRTDDASEAAILAVNCHIRAGNSRDALSSWKTWRASVGSDSEKIRKSALALLWAQRREYGDSKRRRALERARAGDSLAWIDVLAADCRFEVGTLDPPTVDDDRLEHDLGLARTASNLGPTRLHELEAFAGACRDPSTWPLDALPEQTALLAFVLDELRPLTSDESRSLVTTHGAELARRARTGDSAAWRVLYRIECQFARDSGRLSPELAELTRAGVERFADGGAAANMLDIDSLSVSQPVALRLFDRFPSSADLAMARQEHAADEFKAHKLDARDLEKNLIEVLRAELANFGRGTDFPDIAHTMELLPAARSDRH